VPLSRAARNGQTPELITATTSSAVVPVQNVYQMLVMVFGGGGNGNGATGGKYYR
jgi:hypothetical protein